MKRVQNKTVRVSIKKFVFIYSTNNTHLPIQNISNMICQNWIVDDYFCINSTCCNMTIHICIRVDTVDIYSRQACAYQQYPMRLQSSWECISEHLTQFVFHQTPWMSWLEIHRDFYFLHTMVELLFLQSSMELCQGYLQMLTCWNIRNHFVYS